MDADTDAQTFIARFERWAQRRSSAIALISRSEQLTYCELQARASRIASGLRSLGIGAADVVGICHERNSNLLASILGVLTAGCAYLPLDPAYPQDRIVFMATVGQVRAIVASAGTRDRVATWLPATKVVSSEDLLDALTPETSDHQSSRSMAGPDDAAYLIFTSGSTGLPKGVVVEHRSLSNFLQWCETRMTPTRLARVMATSSMCFDSSVFEMFAPLWAGGTVIVVESALHAVSFPGRPDGTLFSCAPSVISELLRTGWMPEGIETLVLAGEQVPETLIKDLLSRFDNLAVYNCYGLTEATVFSTIAELHMYSESPASIGVPISNTQIYVLDERRQSVPAGVTGEIYVAGHGVARGYLNQANLTDARFMDNPFRPGERMLRTGDIGYFRANTDLVCTGRIDDQVKLYGFRIEPVEIEMCLCRHPNIMQCVVLMRRFGEHEMRLVAYYVQLLERDDIEALRSFLQERLPHYMIPTHFVSLPSMPLNLNGKVDRFALREMHL